MARARRVGVVRRASLALAAFAGASVAGVLPIGGVPASCASADTSLRVGIVVDFGSLAGSQGAPATPAVQCASVRDGANGFDVLDASGHTYRVNGSGLLCAIDQFPSGSECGDRTATGYRYWAYFHGSAAGWTYSGQGPGNVVLHTAEVEGWHFVEGKGNPTDPPPNGPSDPAKVCPSAPAPTTPTVPATHVTAPPPTAPPTTVAGAPPTSALPPGGGPMPPTTGVVPSSGATDPSQPGADGTDTTDVPPGTAPDDGTANPTGTDGTAAVTDGARGAVTDGTSGPRPGAVGTSANAGSAATPLAVIAVLALIVVLAGGAALRFRSSEGAT